MTSLFENRSRQVDYTQLDSLHYLGNYVRKLPVSMARMMENALDWEHLPFVHSSSFADIREIEAGKWGWRAEATLPPPAQDQTQMLELLLDNGRHYWATATLSGPGTGMQIHTQARELSDDEIEVDVRFYLPDAPQTAEQAGQVLTYMQMLYARLYDEDQGLMTGRQEALDRKTAKTALTEDFEDIAIGLVAEITAALPYLFDTAKGRICVNRHDDRWIAYGAECPHLLGPLEGAEISPEGSITCPWHGYRFNVQDGRNLDSRCRSLPIWTDALYERDGRLMFRPIRD